MGRRVLRLLRRGRPAELRHLDPAGRAAPAQLHDQGAVRRRRGDRALQLPAAADVLEGRARARRREHAGLQAAASESAVESAAGPVLRRSAARRGQHRDRRPRDGRGPGPPSATWTSSPSPGSVAAGRRIAAQAGQDLKKVNLELGSVDPFIVFEDADLDVAVPGVAWARLLNAGQVCTSPKRVYLVEPIAEEFTRRLEAYVAHAPRGRPDGSDGRRRAADLRRGARPGRAPDRAGGRGGRPGAAGRPPHAAAAGSAATSSSRRSSPACVTARSPTTEEIFGPVLSLTVARDADEAIAMANDSRYGLGASIYTKRPRDRHAGDAGASRRARSGSTTR